MITFRGLGESSAKAPKRAGIHGMESSYWQYIRLIRLNGQPLQLCKLRDGTPQFQYHKSYLLYGLFKV